MSKIKNIIIINDFDYIQGGASKVAIDTANLLADKYSVYFFSGDSKNNNNDLKENVKKICTNQGETLKDKNKLRGIVNGIYNFKARKQLKNLLLTLDKNETIIHVHGWTKSLSSSIFDISWKMGFKLVLTMHDYFTACPNGGYFNYKKNEICHLKPLSMKCIKCNCDSRNYAFKVYRIIRQFVQNHIVRLNTRLTDVISISDFSEKILKKTLNPKVRIHKVYNPIDFDGAFVQNEYKKNKYFLYVGRISKEKGVDVFCKAISELKLTGIVVGDGPEKIKLQSKYPNIDFVGWKNSKEVKAYMKDAKALIFPSLLYEVAPLTPLEAAQFGIPCISSDCNAASDIIKDYKIGYLFNIKKSDLNDTITKFNNASEDIEQSNFKKIYNIYNYDNYSKNIMKTYSDILT